MALPDGLPPMAAGLFGYLGYDMVRQIEHLPNPPPDTLGLPDAILLRPTITAIFDTREGRDHRRDAGLAAKGRGRQGGLCARHRTAGRGGGGAGQALPPPSAEVPPTCPPAWPINPT